MTETLPLSELAFEVRRSARRKRLGIAVERAGSRVVSAPLECPVEHIEEARAKRWWVSRTLAAQELLPPPWWRLPMPSPMRPAKPTRSAAKGLWKR